MSLWKKIQKIFFPFISNGDIITFPSCCREEKTNDFPPKILKVSPIAYGEEKLENLEKFPIFPFN